MNARSIFNSPRFATLTAAVILGVVAAFPSSQSVSAAAAPFMGMKGATITSAAISSAPKGGNFEFEWKVEEGEASSSGWTGWSDFYRSY